MEFIRYFPLTERQHGVLAYPYGVVMEQDRQENMDLTGSKNRLEKNT